MISRSERTLVHRRGVRPGRRTALEPGLIANVKITTFLNKSPRFYFSLAHMELISGVLIDRTRKTGDDKRHPGSVHRKRIRERVGVIDSVE